jgi:hypothetical protein
MSDLARLLDQALTGRFDSLTIWMTEKGPQVNLRNADTGGWICDQRRGGSPAGHLLTLLEEQVGERPAPSPTMFEDVL